jgi:serine/threonine protein kinase
MLAHASNLVANRYELLSRLGEGGMGVVDAAYDRLTGSRVALKRVPLAPPPGASSPAAEGAGAPDSTNRRQVREALATEFHTLAALRHPNIISVLDYGFDREQTPFFTMELLPAPQTLVAAAAGLPLAQQIELVAQLLRALAYLHRHHIVHRDLKPSKAAVLSRRTESVPRARYFLPRPRADGAGRGA